ncbi:BrnA antitoxin family protein [uncultured Herbaspirillum sp.]|uniref:BrnA antitoxin family protein n=1 Tax=uncultured Herbaspirillum sp. TaxID=160236 RepID=UPI00258A9882|nr:BrnA antitoxin family protein [uncultured Herbaspirillum sp.]
MNAPEKIQGTVENWENGSLGKDVNHVRQAPRELERQIDDAQGMQAISIRLDKELIEKFKQIAKIHGMGYQPLMREALKRFAEAEIKILLAALANASEKSGHNEGKQTVEVQLEDLQQRRVA